MNLRILALVASIALTSSAALAAPVLGQAEAPVVGVVHGQLIRTQDAEELRYYVLHNLTDRYAEKKGIVVTRGEIERYQKHLDSVMKRDEERRGERLVELKRLLQDPALPAAQREAMAAELRTLESLRDSAVGRGAGSAEERAAREQIAKAFIRQWKINRALYQQYGGRVILQQGGPEPLDAYRKFLEDSGAHGDFVITDKSMENGFWRYYRDDAMHTFLQSGSKEAKRAFATPPWSVR